MPGDALLRLKGCVAPRVGTSVSAYVALDVPQELIPLNHSFLQREMDSPTVTAELEGPFIHSIVKTSADMASPRHWEAIAAHARSTGRLRTAVLGMSVSAGCGALAGRYSPAAKQCDVRHSWSRVWHDSVVGSIGFWAAVQTDVQFKNAVSRLLCSEWTNLFS